MQQKRQLITARDLGRTEEFLHAKIPLTRAMGIRVVSHANDTFSVEAPVALNYNHMHTAFGGSINAVATLAAYAFLWLRLGDERVVVVRESTIRFVRPVRETIRATCEQPADATLDRFNRTLKMKGRASIELRVVVEESDLIAAEFTGAFVASARD